MKAIVPTQLRKRVSDAWGAGHYGAPRGDRKHNGQDYLIDPDCQVLSPVDGMITKLGLPYPNSEYRYVEVTTEAGYRHRVFYIWPVLDKGKRVKEGQVIGISQDIGKKYPGMPNHIHYEVKFQNKFIDPEEGIKNGQSEV